MKIKANENWYYFDIITIMLWLITLGNIGTAFGALTFIIGIFSICCAFDWNN